MGIDPNEYRIAMASRPGRSVLTPKKRAAPTRKEREIQAAILAYLKLVPGVVAWRTNSGAAMLPKSRMDGSGTFMPVRFGFKGLSDIIGWVSVKKWETGSVCAFDGHRSVHTMPLPTPVARFLAIEVKRPGKFPTVEQQAFLDAVTAAGGIGIVARSVEDVRRVVQP